jgi:Fe2+ or Zn2+ uptake regulation protein
VKDVEALIESEMRFTGVHHSLEFFGHCAECSDKILAAADKAAQA